jgi:two-component system, OmpR family, phosphate regulon sensor histidine kinase PhoR
MAWLSEGERRARVEDTTRDRTILINQTLLAGATLVAVLFALALSQVIRPTSFVIGLALVYTAAAAAVLVPWRRLPSGIGGILPAIDIIAIGFLRESAPSAGLGLLWAFPAMWLGSTFGIPGVIGSTGAVSIILFTLTAADPTQAFSASTVLLPVTIAALSTMSHLTARRAQAQRELLEKQSAHLQRSVDRARRQEDLVTEVLDAVDFGVIRITPTGELVVTNEAHARLQGASDYSDDLQVYTSDGVTPLAPEHRPLARARTGEAFENDLVWYGAAGEGRRALTVTARRLADIDGSHAGTIVVSRDVTTEEQALRAREDLVASVSHELRTPLTSIIGYLDLVLDSADLPDPARRDLGVAERNAARLLELVTDILAMSTVSRHGVDFGLQRTRTDVGAIVLAAVQAAAPPAAERRISIATDDVVAAYAVVDPHRVRQVVDNLVSNAVKYGVDGGHVGVGVATDDDHLWITVADDGTGISAEERPLLFERFFRADAVRNSTTHGSGLGLAISRDIVRAHGGDILVETEIGHGSAFTVRLPLGDEEERG